MQYVFIGDNLHEMSNLFLGHICIRKNISEVILPGVLRVQSFFFSFFLHLISLPVLPNGPIRKSVQLFPVFIVRKKGIGFSVPRGWITFWNIM